MFTSNDIAPLIPFLRRYARALTGSQTSGDWFVAAALESLIKESHVLESDRSPRVELFRLFSEVWNSGSLSSVPTADAVSPADVHLGRIGAMPRQAFLLVSVEGFAENDAAYILDVEPEELRRLVDQSGRELAAQIATDVLIIEDEALIALDLENLVSDLGHRTIGVARTHHDALALARTTPPGLILADIQLADGSSGLSAVNDLLNSFEVPVIFITAFPERFLSGERPEPVFLVSKPYQHATVSAVISQALFFKKNAVRRGRRGEGD